MALPPPGHLDGAGGSLGGAWVTKVLRRQQARTGQEAGALEVSLSAPQDRGVAVRRLQIGRSRLSRPSPSYPIPSCPVPSCAVPCRQESRAMLHWGYDEHNGRERRPGPSGRPAGARGKHLPSLGSAAPAPSAELDELKCFGAWERADFCLGILQGRRLRGVRACSIACRAGPGLALGLAAAFPVGISFARLAQQLRAQIEYVVDSCTDGNCCTSSAFLIPDVFCFCYTVGNPTYLTGLFKCITAPKFKCT